MNDLVERMDIHQAQAWLDDHVDLERVGSDVAPPPPSLERIRSVVELLGSPQLEFPSLHVTGTNGKTSTARMISALLTEMDVSTGSYTSPHLERVNERLARDGEPISDFDLADTLSRVALVEDFVAERPTFFEILTAAALSWFADIAVEAAVVEVGLGEPGMRPTSSPATWPWSRT
ncbi:MAG: Mur ligase family protein [Acidimicrobiia bacterium]|nr:Mur ligase family protein [Acidimicrobiia bacterium]